MVSLACQLRPLFKRNQYELGVTSLKLETIFRPAQDAVAASVEDGVCIGDGTVVFVNDGESLKVGDDVSILDGIGVEVGDAVFDDGGVGVGVGDHLCRGRSRSWRRRLCLDW